MKWKINNITWKHGFGGLIFLLVAVLFSYNPLKKAAQLRYHKHRVSQNEILKNEIWTCPMHPQVKKGGPGKCPICGMDLVKKTARVSDPRVSDPRFEDKERAPTRGGPMPSGHGSFVLSPSRRQMIGLKLGNVEQKEMYKSIEVAGRIAFDPELYTAQNEYLEALKQLESVRQSPLEDVRQLGYRMVESAKLRLKILGLSDKQISDLKALDSSSENLLLPEKEENLWVYAEIYEMDLPYVKPGLKAKISATSLEGETLEGEVIAVDRVINPATRTAKVRISIPNGKTGLRPEAYVTVKILSPLGIQTTVPFDAVFDTGKEAWVFVYSTEGVIDPRLITIRFRSGDEVAVQSGLKAGERIVTSANFLIDSESRLKGIFLPETGGSDSHARPQCPEGQFWHAEMKHCMPKAGPRVGGDE